jgi:four helix bundle protein
MEQSITKAKQLEERLLNFSVAVINYAETLQLQRSIVDQLIRSAASIGANYTEALNASSKMDFRNKIYIAKKEAAETRYWLQLIGRLNQRNLDDELVQECQHILMILQKTVNTINEKRKSKDQ